MAEAATARINVLQGLEDLTECSIHRGTYENPRQLPCLHSFCLQCLVNYTKDNPLTSSITCPLCRKEITVPAEGIEGFPRNFFIDKVIEIKRLTGPLQKDTLCDICQEDEDLASDAIPVASTFCAECRKNLCDRCTMEHRRQNKSHSVLKMGSEEISEQLVKKLEVSFCSDHSGRAVDMFCFDCQCVICLICFAEKHKLHRCSDINNSAKDFRKQMELEITNISVCLSEGVKTKEANEKKKDDFLQQIQSVEKDIMERSEELRRIIDRDRNLLLDELKIIKSSQLKEMQIKDEEIQRHLTIIMSLKTYGEKIVTVGSASDICRSVNQLCTRTKEVQATMEEVTFCEVVCRSVSFQPIEFQENLDRNIFGGLEVNCEKLLVKDLSDSEKSLQKTLNVYPGKKESSVDDNEGEAVSRRFEQLKDQVQVEEYNVPDMVIASDLECVAHDSAKSEATDPHVHSSSMKDQPESSRPSKPLYLTGNHAGIDLMKVIYERSIVPTTGLEEKYEQMKIAGPEGTEMREDTRPERIRSLTVTKSLNDGEKPDNVIGSDDVCSDTCYHHDSSTNLEIQVNQNQSTESQPSTTPVNSYQGQIFYSRSFFPPPHRQFLIKCADNNTLHFTSNRTYNVLNIFIHIRNIVDQRTQVLVSSANCQLITHGNVSKAILKAAGQSVVDERSQTITTQRLFPFGAVIPTKAGNLGPHVEAILHAIIPTSQEFQKDPQRAFNILIHVFVNALCMSSGQKKSVSFPAIGSEIVGLHGMVEAFIRGLRAFDQRVSSWPDIVTPGEIHLISEDLSKQKTILEALHPLVATCVIP